MSIAKQLIDQVTKLNSGTVFCANDFCALGSRGNIDVILHRLAKSGVIRRLGFGLYDKPRKSSLLGDLTPNVATIMQAYARRTGQKIILDPLGAANALSLTTQVPAQITFLTDGKSHTLQICNIEIKLIHASPKKLAGADTSVGIIIQALRYFGKHDLPQRVVKALAQQLSSNDLQALKSIRNKTIQYITPQIDRIIKYASVH